jgi:hypothetical protein
VRWIGQCPDSWHRPSTRTLLLTLLSDIAFFLFLILGVLYGLYTLIRTCEIDVNGTSNEVLMLFRSGKKCLVCYSCQDQAHIVERNSAAILFFTPSLFYLLNLEGCTVVGAERVRVFR